MDTYKSFENSQNAPKLICQIVCQSPKVWDFDEIKASLFWVFPTSPVRILQRRANFFKNSFRKTVELSYSVRNAMKTNFAAHYDLFQRYFSKGSHNINITANMMLKYLQ